MSKKKVATEEDDKLVRILRDYAQGQSDMEQRKNRKNGWNDVLRAHQNVLPNPWPFQAKVTEPLIRTTILEKNGRLLNGKLRGRLIPREGGDMVKARINNALIDFQWDRANLGGTMLEKVSDCDQITRIFGNAYVWVYWDTEKDCNEMKVIDPRDILIDRRLDHIRSARGNNWIIVREWSNPETLREQGYDIPELEPLDQRATTYDNVIKAIRGVEDFNADGQNPALEVCHYMTCKETVTFLPRHKVILKTKANKKNKIQVSMLRYYKVPGDIQGESEVEPVMSIARTVNWFLSGFMEEGNKIMHPPVITSRAGVELPTIVHTPNAIWIANNPDSIKFPTMGNGIINAFNNIYPMLKNSFQTAMGSQSIGVSPQQGGTFQDKTATEVNNQAQQQNVRDQFNQLFLGEFLKDIMMMWVANNKEYLLDDPTKSTYVLRIVGQETMRQFQKMGLGEMDVPGEAMSEISNMVSQNPSQYSDQQLKGMIDQVKQPRFPVVTNPEAEPQDYNVVPKLEMVSDEEAKLHIEKDDFEGEYDFIPDVVSMSAGASLEQKKERRETFGLLTTPEASQNLATDGYKLKYKELYSSVLTDAKYENPESYFEQIQQPVPGANPGMPGVNPSQGQPGLPVPPGMAQPAMPMANTRPQPGQVPGAVRPQFGGSV